MRFNKNIRTLAIKVNALSFYTLEVRLLMTEPLQFPHCKDKHFTRVHQILFKKMKEKNYFFY